MKLKYTKFKQRHILVCSGLKKEGVNRKELDILYDPPEGLLRVVDYDESKRTITYDVGCCVPLKLYYKQKCFTEDEVLMMVRQLLTILGNMEKSRLTMQKLVLEFKNVFYNIDQRMLQIVFCPVQNNYSPLESEQIFSFLKEIVTNAVIVRNGKSDADKIQSFLFFLKKQQQFSAKAIAVFFDESNAGSIIEESHIEFPKSSSTGFSTKSQPYSTRYPTQKPYTPGFTSNSPEAMGGFRQSQQSVSTSVPFQSPIPQRPVPVSQTNYGQQTIPPVSTSKAPIDAPSDTIDIAEEELNAGLAVPSDTLDTSETAYLRNESTGIEYELPFGDCVIGRVGVDGNGNTVKPDLVVTENKRVGKFHAKIIYDGFSYYIIDLASKNKTRVNNQIIESGFDPISGSFNGKRTKIENGTKIQLASEGFIFILKEA